MKARTRPAPAGGFTLAEAVLSAAFLSSLLLVAGLATDRCFSLFRQQRASQTLSATAYRLLHRVTSEVVGARRASCLPSTVETQGSSSLSFQRSLGVDDGAVNWSPVTTLRWELETGELDDDRDNNGNGLVDEGQLVWIEREGTPEERRVVLGHGLVEFLSGETFDGADEDGDGLIDERGLCFSLAGNVLTIRIGVEEVAPGGQVLQKHVETSVYLRN
jgi:hypothetical protein